VFTYIKTVRAPVMTEQRKNHVDLQYQQFDR